MRALRIGLTAGALILASTWAAKADGIDPVLKMGGGSGSPPCVQNGVSFQATADSSGDISGACENNTGSVITSFSFEILLSDVPGGTPTNPNVTPELGPLLEAWVVSCGAIDGGLILNCTASNPESQCRDSDSECDISGPQSEHCEDVHFYTQFGILQGCDATVSTVVGGGTFAPDAAFDIVPNGVTPDPLVPEPATLSMLLFGLGGLPFLRRRLAR